MTSAHLLVLSLLGACDPPPPCGLGSDIETQAGLWFADEDEDGFGDPAVSFVACSAVANRVQNTEDCDDTRRDVFPDAPDDVCDGVDNDCDGQVDEDAATAWFYDEDGDGAGGTVSVTTCDPPQGFVAASDDCDDDDPETHPGAVELCDDRDNDCDGGISEAITARCYPDADRDGHGDDTPGAARVLCGGSCAFADATAPDDCDDRDAATWTGAPESCDGQDNDCQAGTWVDEGADCGTGTSPAIDPSSGHVYLPVSTRLTWGGAATFCAARGYHLAWISDGVEAAFLQALYTQQTGQTGMWVGLRWDACGEGITNYRQVDTRFTPWRCNDISAWEDNPLPETPIGDSALLSSGGLSVQQGNLLSIGAMCEVEP